MLSLAIGREGQNARLAARLTGWRIDIRSDVAAAEAATDAGRTGENGAAGATTAGRGSDLARRRQRGAPPRSASPRRRRSGGSAAARHRRRSARDEGRSRVAEPAGCRSRPHRPRTARPPGGTGRQAEANPQGQGGPTRRCRRRPRRRPVTARPLPARPIPDTELRRVPDRAAQARPGAGRPSAGRHRRDRSHRSGARARRLPLPRRDLLGRRGAQAGPRARAAHHHPGDRRRRTRGSHGRRPDPEPHRRRHVAGPNHRY